MNTFFIYGTLMANLLFSANLHIDSSTQKDKDKSVIKIAFGSCNRESLPQPLWSDILNETPKMWIWLGDNIYGDTNNMAEMRDKYNKQIGQEAYRHLKQQVQVVGTWDDHDYGINDGGKGFLQKEASQQLMLDFLDEPGNSLRRSQKGIFTSYDKKWGKMKVKIILLDTRYHRDTIYKNEDGYIPNETGTILGENQWLWLEKSLNKSKADINILASSIQVIPTEHRFEKWENFPNERKRLFKLISKSKAKGVIMLSGDRHIAEVSKIEVEGMDYPLYEITSSGLTHTWKTSYPEKNKHREGDLIISKNYGVLKITKNKKKVSLDVMIKGQHNKTLYQKTIGYSAK